MHPIFSHLRRLGLYLLAWIPIAGMLAYLLTIPGQITPREAVTLAIPLSLIYAFVCLSSWYSCRGNSLEKYGLGRLISTHVTAALIASIIWAFVAVAFASSLSKMPAFAGLSARFRPEIPVIVGSGLLLYLLSVTFFYIIIAVDLSRDAEARVMQASVLARDAELKALKAQVNPHFLFNSLNSISALTTSDSAKAREMCILLGDFLRRTLGLGEKTAIPLEEELSLIHAFLAVEKVRFGARIQMEENIDKRALDVPVPPLLLQPLVENAVVHGIANLVEGGWIRLSVQCDNGGGDVSIIVENRFDPEAPARRRNGVGLANVRQRLQARYGNRASFAVKAEADSYRVALTFPAERGLQTT
jgi:two-component system, LytTR family, sensor histidine kinase AlgZ